MTRRGIDLPPGGRPLVAGLVALAAVRAGGLILIAGGIAEAIASLAAGTTAWESASVLAAIGVVVRSLATWAAAVVAARGASRAKTELRGRMAAQIVRDNASDGATAVLATEGLDGLDDYYGTVVATAVQAAVIPVVLIVRILTADWLSALVVGLAIPLIPMFMILIGMHTREKAEAAAGALARLSNHLVELARGLPVLVGLGRVDEQTSALEQIQTEYRERTRRTLRTAFLSSLALELIATLSVAVVAVLLGVRLLSGELSLATALLVLLLAPDCFAALRDVGAAFHSSQNGRTALASVKELLARVQRPRRLRPGGSIRVQGLSVRFDDRRTSALLSTTATFEFGQITAVTGASGVGKSTLLAALAGTLPPTARISGWVGGVDPDGVAYAPQAPRTFAPTVRDELALYAENADRVDGVVRELDLVRVADADPATISPGEVRRVAVARALLGVDRGARLMILDEPTAHLDDLAASRVREAILRRREHAAVILVSHDPATLAIADRSVRLDDSRPEVSDPARVEPDTTRRPAAARSLRRPTTGRAASLLGTMLLPDAARWVGSLVWGILAVGLGLALTAVSGWLIVQAGSQTHIMYLLVAIVGVRFFGLGRSVARYMERLATHDAVIRMVDHLRLKLWSSIAARGAASRSLAEGGSALDYLVTLSTDVRESLPRIVPAAVGAASVAGVALTIGIVTPSMGGIAGPVLLGTLVSTMAIALGRERTTGRLRTTVRSALVRQWLALGSAAADLRSNGVAPRALARLAETDRRRADVERAGAWTSGLTAALAGLGTGLLATAVPAMAVDGGVPAELAAVVALLLLATAEPIASAANAAQRIPAFAATLGTLSTVLASAPATHGDATLRDPVQRLGLDDISARWPESASPVFAGLSAQVAAGRWLGVHGPSGSGKSTLLTVLLGQLAVDSGAVRADGWRLSDLTAASWRLHVAWCPQEAHVFDSTLRGNLLIGRTRYEGVSEAEMVDALDRVGLTGLLSGMTAGLDTFVGAAGLALSGGERQRLAVARALLKGADILLLDEPTAHLDDATAAAMMGDIRNASGDRIVVLVSHRPADHDPADADVHLHDGTFAPADIAVPLLP